MASSSASKTQVPARILLVDDNAAGLAARRVVLEELGYATHGIKNPKDALSHFERAAEDGTPYDLVVTDFRMPEYDGIEFIRRIRAHTPAMPVILISGFVDALGLTEKSTGANVVIMKSANEVPHLIRAANRLLGSTARKKPPTRAVIAKRAVKRTGTS
jgi:CheY-like chemotaxis protein